MILTFLKLLPVSSYTLQNLPLQRCGTIFISPHATYENRLNPASFSPHTAIFLPLLKHINFYTFMKKAGELKRISALRFPGSLTGFWFLNVAFCQNIVSVSYIL